MSADHDMNEQKPEVKDKATLFAENPDRFIDQQDVILMVRRHPETGQLGVLIRVAETMNVADKDQITATDVYEEALKIQGYTHRKLSGFISAIEQTVAKRSAATSIVGAKTKNPGFLNNLRNGMHRR